MKRKWMGELLLCIMAFGLIGLAYASDTDQHQVTVQVNAINEVAVQGGDITLTINSATAGQDPAISPSIGAFQENSAEKSRGISISWCPVIGMLSPPNRLGRLRTFSVGR